MSDHSNTSAHHPVGPEDEHHHEHDEHAHHGGVGKYLAVFAALCILTLLSFWVANSPLMETRKVGWALMMAISCGKALLVICFFMHLIWEANWKYVLTIPATMMSIFLVLMLVPDIAMRTYDYSDERWSHAAQPRAEQDHKAEEGHEGHEGGAGHKGHEEHEGGAGHKGHEEHEGGGATKAAKDQH